MFYGFGKLSGKFHALLRHNTIDAIICIDAKLDCFEMFIRYIHLVSVHLQDAMASSRTTQPGYAKCQRMNLAPGKTVTVYGCVQVDSFIMFFKRTDFPPAKF